MCDLRISRHLAMRFFSFILCTLILTMASGAQAQMQRVLGVDGQGFKQPVPAFAVMVPQGWQPRGGVFWNVQDRCNPYGYLFNWAAMSPDERYGVAVLPAMRWITTDHAQGQPCPVLRVNSARDALAQMIGQMQPDAQMIDYRPRPDFLHEMGLQPSQTDLGGGAWAKIHVDAGEALFGFNNDQGQPMRMTVGLAIVVNETFMPGGGVTADFRFLQGQSLPAWLAFAPDGELNMQIAEQMRKSVQINPEWQNRITQHQSKINKDNARTQTNIANINRETSEYVSKLSREGHENRMRALDRSGEAFSNVISDRELWRDSDGSKLNAPMGGDNMWRLDNGNYVSTNDPNFNPLSQTGQFGTQLERWND